jgi:hypothetical protein
VAYVQLPATSHAPRGWVRAASGALELKRRGEVSELAHASVFGGSSLTAVTKEIAMQKVWRRVRSGSRWLHSHLQSEFQSVTGAAV